jgi:hypothetical protein
VLFPPRELGLLPELLVLVLGHLLLAPLYDTAHQTTSFFSACGTA